MCKQTMQVKAKMGGQVARVHKLNIIMYCKMKTDAFSVVFQQLELLKTAMPRVQDSIITLINLASKNPEGEGVAAGINLALDELKATDKSFREKLLVLQMAKEKGWKAAEKLQRRLNGEYENPHVAKVMEEEEKLKEKEKKEREKDRAKTGELCFIYTKMNLLN